MGITPVNWIATGANKRDTASQAISGAIITSTTALVNPARPPSSPAPKVNRGSSTSRRA